jgi:hypothetical protein
MTRTDQRSWEQFHLDLFGRLQPEALPGVPVLADPPAPDALLFLPDKTRGIELTTFLWDATSPTGSPARALHSLRKQVMEHAAQLWDSQQQPAVDVSLIWNVRQCLLGSDVKTVSEQLVDLIARHVPDIDAHLTIAHPAPMWKELPKHTAAVFVARPAWLTKSIWDFSQAGSVPHLRDTFGRLQKILDEKDPKIPGYRKRCDEVYLLIVADGTTMQSLVVIDEDEVPIHSLVSSFDAAYFLSVTYQRVLKLSISRPS